MTSLLSRRCSLKKLILTFLVSFFLYKSYQHGLIQADPEAFNRFFSEFGFNNAGSNTQTANDALQDYKMQAIQQSLDQQNQVIAGLLSKLSGNLSDKEKLEVDKILETQIEVGALAVDDNGGHGSNNYEYEKQLEDEDKFENYDEEEGSGSQSTLRKTNLLQVNHRGEVQIIDGIQDLSDADKELIQENIYQAQDKLARAYGGREAIKNIEREDIADIHDVIVEENMRIGREMAMKGANSRVDDGGRITTPNDRTFDAEEFTNKMIQAGEKFQGDCSVKMAPPGSYEPVPLLSFPGCGNTWARHLIEKATGIYTGSVYHDGGLYNHGHYRGEMEHPLNGTTIVQKVHRLRSNQYSNALFRRAEYCIFLIRDPRKAFISEYTRLVSHNHMGVVTASIFKGEEWERKASTWANIGFPDCYSLPLQQNSCSGEIKYMFYEDLRKVDLDEDYSSFFPFFF